MVSYNQAKSPRGGCQRDSRYWCAPEIFMGATYNEKVRDPALQTMSIGMASVAADRTSMTAMVWLRPSE